MEKQETKIDSHVVLTSHSNLVYKDSVEIHWGQKTRLSVVQ
jgi:hypothetical protein